MTTQRAASICIALALVGQGHWPHVAADEPATDEDMVCRQGSAKRCDAISRLLLNFNPAAKSSTSNAGRSSIGSPRNVKTPPRAVASSTASSPDLLDADASPIKQGDFVVALGRLGILRKRRDSFGVVQWIDDAVEDVVTLSKITLAPKEVLPHGWDCSPEAIVQRLVEMSAEEFPNAALALQHLNEIYEGKSDDALHIEFDLSVALNEAKNATQSAKAGIYGEIQPGGFVHLLNSLQASQGMRYYDLGSGFGKTVILAGLLGLKAKGIEVSTAHHAEACKAWERSKKFPMHGGEVDLIFGSFLEEDFSDADIVFINSFTFPDDLMANIVNAASGLKPGSFLVTASRLPGEKFKVLKKIRLPTSWRNASTYFIHGVAD
mmetsp:Transcript_145319/g.278831  ORF Transcript_145319/g.278831 Transcript_145319/m.278831 type:complete len:378 (+) Transcript_145319:60-1193(+)